MASLQQHDVVAADVNRQFDGTQTVGEMISDRVASFGGSWRFIIGFGLALSVWMAWNSRPGSEATFDPFPFIFLNLILSCLAAIQAPVIMMSQDRQVLRSVSKS